MIDKECFRCIRELDGRYCYNVWMTYAEDEVWQVESIIIEEGSL